MDTLHAIVLFLHSAVRWLVLALGVVAILRCVRGALAGETSFADKDAKLVRGFAGAFDAQILLGALLWLGVSPLGVRMFGNAAVAMKQSSLRFFMIEHVFGMLICAAILHVGTVRARRAPDAKTRYRKTAITLGIAFLVLFASIPWPFFPYARPLLRGF